MKRITFGLFSISPSEKDAAVVDGDETSVFVYSIRQSSFPSAVISQPRVQLARQQFIDCFLFRVLSFAFIFSLRRQQQRFGEKLLSICPCVFRAHFRPLFCSRRSELLALINVKPYQWQRQQSLMCICIAHLNFPARGNRCGFFHS